MYHCCHLSISGFVFFILNYRLEVLHIFLFFLCSSIFGTVGWLTHTFHRGYNHRPEKQSLIIGDLLEQEWHHDGRHSRTGSNNQRVISRVTTTKIRSGYIIIIIPLAPTNHHHFCIGHRPHVTWRPSRGPMVIISVVTVTMEKCYQWLSSPTIPLVGFTAVKFFVLREFARPVISGFDDQLHLGVS